MNEVEAWVAKYIPKGGKKEVLKRAGLHKNYMLHFEKRKQKPLVRHMFFLLKAMQVEHKHEFEQIAGDLYDAIKKRGF